MESEWRAEVDKTLGEVCVEISKRIEAEAEARGSVAVAMQQRFGSVHVHFELENRALDQDRIVPRFRVRPYVTLDVAVIRDIIKAYWTARKQQTPYLWQRASWQRRRLVAGSSRTMPATTFAERMKARREQGIEDSQDGGEQASAEAPPAPAEDHRNG